MILAAVGAQDMEDEMKRNFQSSNWFQLRGFAAIKLDFLKAHPKTKNKRTKQ